MHAVPRVMSGEGPKTRTENGASHFTAEFKIRSRFLPDCHWSAGHSSVPDWIIGTNQFQTDSPATQASSVSIRRRSPRFVKSSNNASD